MDRAIRILTLGGFVVMGCTALNGSPRISGTGGETPIATGSGGIGPVPIGGQGGHIAGTGGVTAIGTGGVVVPTGSGGVHGSAGVQGGGGQSAAGHPGGYAGAGTAIVPDAMGHVIGSTNAYGITGSWYPYADGIGSAGTTATGDCEVARHPAADCSAFTAPPPATAFANTGGKMCTKGTVAQILDMVGSPGMPDYGKMYGAAIALDLNYTTTKGTFNAGSNVSGTTVTGFAFDLQLNLALGSGLRIEFPTPSTDGNQDGAAYWGGDFTYVSSPVAAGTNKVYFADVRGPRNGAFDQTKIESIAFHVPTNTTAKTSYDFCVSNVTVLTDKGGGCPPSLAGGSCNIPACGCSGTDVCYPDTAATGLACFTGNGLTEGADCTNKTCASGLGCFGGVCRKYCHSDVDCPLVDSARACTQTVWSSNSAPIPDVLVCNRVCDPVSPQSPHTPLLSCPAGFACLPSVTAPGSSDCVKWAGVGSPGASCVSSADCAPGHFCGSGSDICWHYCLTSADCPSSSTCTAFTTPVYAGAKTVGYCSQ